MHAQPVISVIIPVYNREKYIGQAIQSVLDQTLTNFEIIVVDDGSSDGTLGILEDIGDHRVQIVRHQSNLGIPNARNSGLEQARGRYIAWLDSDDRCRPKRLQVQASFLDRHPGIAMIGTCAARCDDAGNRLGGIQVPPAGSGDIRAWHLFRSSFKQSSIMGRAEVLKRYPYREDLPVCEDFDVGIRISNDHVTGNLYRVLVERRVHQGRTIYQEDDRFREKNKELQKQQLTRLGLEPTDEDLGRHFLLPHLKRYGIRPDDDCLEWAEDWLAGLRRANRQTGYYDTAALDTATAVLWIHICLQTAAGTGPTWRLRRMVRSPLTAGIGSRRVLKWLGSNAWLRLCELARH